MDVGYRAIGGQDGDAVYTDFRPSLTVLTTVVSTTLDDRVSVDAGIKSFATDSPALPEAKGWEGLQYKFFGDEFGLLTAADGGQAPQDRRSARILRAPLRPDRQPLRPDLRRPRRQRRGGLADRGAERGEPAAGGPAGHVIMTPPRRSHGP